MTKIDQILPSDKKFLNENATIFLLPRHCCRLLQVLVMPLSIKPSGCRVLTSSPCSFSS